MHRYRLHLLAVISLACAFACASGSAAELPPVMGPPEAEDAAAAIDNPSGAQILTLADALRYAHTQGREKQSRDEELKLLAMTLRNARASYGPQPTGTLGASMSGRGNSAPSDAETATLGASQTLPTGGTASVSTTAQVSHAPGAAETKTTSSSASLLQPLLRNAGSLVWREGLTSAERSYIYSMRGYEQYREELTLGISRTFWSLQGQQHALEQARMGVGRSEFLYEQSRALMSIGKSNANDVFRAEVALLAARQSLVDAEAAFNAALDAFKFDLNLPVDERLAIDTAPPSGPKLEVDAKRAIATAMTHRLDLMTTDDRVADAQRALTLSRRALLPQLDLNASVGYGGAPASDWHSPVAGDPSYTVGMTLQIPFNRRGEELSYEQAMIARIQASRALEAQKQSIIRQVLEAIRNLRSAEASLLIQERNRTQTRNRAEKAFLDFKAGLISNLDIVEAQNEVRQGENAWFGAIVSYRSAELQLRHDTGTLMVSDAGAWSDAAPEYATTVGVLP